MGACTQCSLGDNVAIQVYGPIQRKVFLKDNSCLGSHVDAWMSVVYYGRPPRPNENHSPPLHLKHCKSPLSKKTQGWTAVPAFGQQ